MRLKFDESMQTFSVTQFVTYVNETFKAIWDSSEVALEGEVCEFRVSQGQWVNFNLKDEQSLISVFMVLRNVSAPIQDGMRVRVFGVPRIYPKYGKFSFSADRIELVGEGALQKALFLLRQRLSEEGLFDPTRKRTLVRFPERIALVASIESAAYGDFIRIVSERWGGLLIDVYHVIVQGEQAPTSIVRALNRIQHSTVHYDALVLTRGGGSLEELMAFNDERVVRAVHASRVPTLVGIGHERDLTLAEETADVRGSTPTDCARLLVPDRRDVLYQIANQQERMEQLLRTHISRLRQQMDTQTFGMEQWVRNLTTRFDLTVRLVDERAHQWISRMDEQITGIQRVLKQADPEQVLRRGYTLVRGVDGRVRTSITQVDAGAALVVQWHDGKAQTVVRSVDRDGRSTPAQASLL